MSDKRMTDQEMAEEARRWAEGKPPTEQMVEVPESVPRAKESVAISIRLPRQMVDILKEFAKRSGIGYQVLIKRWLDERIRREHQNQKRERARQRQQQQQQLTIKLAVPRIVSHAAGFDASGLSDVTAGACCP